MSRVKAPDNVTAPVIVAAVAEVLAESAKPPNPPAFRPSTALKPENVALSAAVGTRIRKFDEGLIRLMMGVTIVGDVSRTTVVPVPVWLGIVMLGVDVPEDARGAEAVTDVTGTAGVAHAGTPKTVVRTCPLEPAVVSPVPPFAYGSAVPVL